MIANVVALELQRGVFAAIDQLRKFSWRHPLPLAVSIGGAGVGYVDDVPQRMRLSCA